MSFKSFRDILLTLKQSNKQTNRQTNRQINAGKKQNLLGPDKHMNPPKAAHFIHVLE